MQDDGEAAPAAGASDAAAPAEEAAKKPAPKKGKVLSLRCFVAFREFPAFFLNVPLVLRACVQKAAPKKKAPVEYDEPDSEDELDAGAKDDSDDSDYDAGEVRSFMLAQVFCCNFADSACACFWRVQSSDEDYSAKKKKGKGAPKPKQKAS